MDKINVLLNAIASFFVNACTKKKKKIILNEINKELKNFNVHCASSLV
tara:strand:- start:37 stop:180 length:144 start_codon:yes stop_codon:yes gene_type:complete